MFTPEQSSFLKYKAKADQDKTVVFDELDKLSDEQYIDFLVGLHDTCFKNSTQPMTVIGILAKATLTEYMDMRINKTRNMVEDLFSDDD